MNLYMGQKTSDKLYFCGASNFHMSAKIKSTKNPQINTVIEMCFRSVVIEVCIIKPISVFIILWVNISEQHFGRHAKQWITEFAHNDG